MPILRAALCLSVLTLSITSTVSAEVTSSADQVRAAVSAAPEALREGARVLGYSAEGDLIELRKGTGELVCLADDPSDERFHVACYHRSLEPFMARGRELRAEGAERADVIKARGEEIAAGTLDFPTGPSALYSLTGPPESFDAEAQVVRGGTRVTSIYVAYATGEATGMSTSPVADGTPWLMAAGEPWAHIMKVEPSHTVEEATD